MAKYTQQECLIRGLISYGWIEIKSTTRKARTFKNHLANARLLFVGKAGSLRTGKTYSKSHPVNQLSKKQTIQKGQILLIADEAAKKAGV